MDLSHLFNKEHHLTCRWLGEKDWLHLSVDPEVGIEYHIENNLYVSDEDRQKYSKFEFSNARKLLDTYASSNAACCFFLAAFCRMLADGPKLYRPTLEHCLAMENTAVNVPFNDYRQPYPVTLIELPAEYVEHIRNEFKTNNPPKYVLCYRDQTGVIAAAAWFGPHNTIVNTLAPLDKFATVEDAIIENNKVILPTYGDVDDRAVELDFKIADLVQRLALNFSFFMTMYGLKVVGPLDPQRHRQSTRDLLCKNKVAKTAAQNYFIAPVYLVEFEQKIKFFDVEDERTAEERAPGDGTHRSPKPHWRQGHYRNQRHGPQLSLVSYRFIKPIMVMKRYFIGDIANTSAVYIEKPTSSKDAAKTLGASEETVKEIAKPKRKYTR